MEADRQPTARIGEGSDFEGAAAPGLPAGEVVEIEVRDGASTVQDEQAGCPARGAALYKKLPHGPHGMDRSAVARNQRVRMYGAVIESVASKGYAKTSVADVIALAGVSRRAFYEHFANKEACVIATHNIAARRTSKAMLHGWESERGWANRLHAACRAMLADIESHPKSSHLVMVDVLGLGRKAYDCVRAYNALFERSLVTGFVLSPDGAMCSPVAPRAIVGGVRQVLGARIDTTRWKRIPGLTDELLDWIACCRTPAVERLGGLPQQPPLPREQLGHPPRFLTGESRRACAMRAIVDLTIEHGFEELTDPQVAHRAGMTTEAFHKQFRTKEQALLAVVEEFCAELRSTVVRAASQGSSWTEGVRLGMAAYIDCIARHPGVSRVAFVELFGVGAGAANHQASVSEAFTDFLADSGATPQRAPTVALEALTGALWAVVGSSVASGRLRFLPATLDHLTFTVLAPYTGPRAAIEAIEEATGKTSARTTGGARGASASLPAARPPSPPPPPLRSLIREHAPEPELLADEAELGEGVPESA
jgi:AcrR family transcriptional regulator